MKLAAIDIGSNAVRLLLSRTFENGDQPYIKKESLVRMPIRLGEDVFGNGRISEEKTGALIKTMVAFKNLMEAYQAIDYMACATAAMREAENGAEVVRRVREVSGIDLEIIDGRREAEIVCLNRPLRIFDKNQVYMFIDVGGGSTEIIVFANNAPVRSQSFPIGGIRVLKDQVKKAQWTEMKKWLNLATGALQPLTAIGSGGNINKIFRMARKKEGEEISYKKIMSIQRFLKKHTYEERIKKLHLRPDRADVIVPAAQIYLSAMKWAKCTKMIVPMAGLSDGLIHIMYEKHHTPAGAAKSA